MGHLKSDPIEEKAAINITEMPDRTEHLVRRVEASEVRKTGLPDCLWKPGPGCTNTTPYECTDNGKCSADNWYPYEDWARPCKSSCLHVALLNPAPYYALWRPGPLARPFVEGDKLPHYEHSGMEGHLQLTKKVASGPILLTPFCKKRSNPFVGVTLFSQSYEVKAHRLLESCKRVGVCCKATLLPADVFGPGAPEGSETFRFKTISMKPSFILSQLKATQLPVVFLDVDLEFHKLPELFLPGSWPDGDRDVAIFNYWGNETNITNRRTPNTGSGVVFFNQTFKAKKLLVAWAEAMAYSHNRRAPDDQVLDTLLVEGGWLARASFGWLPAAYLRTAPAYYQGVDPVIDHDHGNPPGLLKHSETRPRLPPVLKWVDIEKDLRTAKCVAVADLDVYTEINDQWCYNMCAWESCPSDLCVCDWQGHINSEGDTPSLDDVLNTPDADAPGETEDALCPSHPNILRKSKACPTADRPTAPEICPKPPNWCSYAAGTNEPKECGGLPGHFCHDVFGRSGFSPCDETVRPLWGRVKCEAFEAQPKDLAASLDVI
jgi:hypothetical protein